MNDYRVTVIIPNFNKAMYIEECINSILNQTYKLIDIIVVDDCSTDNSLKILKNLEKENGNIKVYKNKINSGVSFSRNFGAKMAKTKYITFIDSDDFYFDNNKLKNEMELIKKYKICYNKDIVSYSKTVFVNNDVSKINYPISIKYDTGNIFEKLVTGYNFDGIMRDYCVKKEVFELAGKYEEGSSYYEDLDLLIRLSKCVEFYCTDEYGTAYRDSLNGLSKKSRYKSFKAKEKIYLKYIRQMPWLKKIMLELRMSSLFLINFIKKIIRKLLKIMK